MLCQNCQKRIANVHFTQVLNGNKVEMYLCEKCANENGEINFDSPFDVDNFFSGLIGFNNSMPYIAPVAKGLVCEKCGMHYGEFQKLGKIGCSNCYSIFGERLQPVIKRLHGAQEHHGKCPVKSTSEIKATREVEHLKELLNKAIQNEEYEKAAELRDKIRSLEVE